MTIEGLVLSYKIAVEREAGKTTQNIKTKNHYKEKANIYENVMEFLIANNDEFLEEYQKIVIISKRTIDMYNKYFDIRRKNLELNLDK